MARTVNKVNHNYNKIVRARKKAFKLSTKTDSSTAVRSVNRRIKARNSGEDELEYDGNVIIRKAKIGKGNSIIAPTEISKKKLRKLNHSQKV
ncbi:hypothetical protein HDU99_010697, partial [Rhizoclosmatium hyalinum]